MVTMQSVARRWRAVAVHIIVLQYMVKWTPIKGTVTNLLVLAYPTHCPPPDTITLLVATIHLSKLWLLGHYSKVPTSTHASSIAC